jgi:hypothetical protein
MIMSSRISKPSGTVPKKRTRAPRKTKGTDPALPQSPLLQTPLAQTQGSEAGLVAEAPAAPTAEADRYAMIAQAAYYRAEKRGFRPGEQLDDWLAAEADITAQWLQKVLPAGDEPRD